MASPLRSLLWSGIETLGTLAIGLASVIVIARLIGPDAFGLAAIGFGLVLVLMVFVSSLVHDGLVQSPDYSELQLDSAFTCSFIAGLLGILVPGLLALPLARLLDEPNLAVVLLGFLPMLLFGSLTTPLIAECRRALDFRTIDRHQLFCRTTGLALGIAIAVAGGGVWSVVAQQLLTSGLQLLTLAMGADPCRDCGSTGRPWARSCVSPGTSPRPGSWCKESNACSCCSSATCMVSVRAENGRWRPVWSRP